MAIYSDLQKVLEKGRKAAIVTVLPAESGNAANIERRLESGTEPGDAAQALSQGAPVIAVRDGTHVIVEPFYPEERLIILGGGHIAVPLVGFASAVGFSATVVDDRPSFANKQRFPAAKTVICQDFAGAIKQLGVTGRDYVVIITRGHRHDGDCLEALLSGAEPYYTGMIGSKRRVRAMKEDFIARGAGAKRLERLYSPIGLAIGAVTPEEIAISIVAELIACKRSGVNQSDVEMDIIRRLAAEMGIEKAVVTVIGAKGSVPRGAGAKMLIYADGRTAGSIGGGCSEADVLTQARQIIGTGRYCLRTLDMTGDVAENDGMVCGGVMQVLIEDD